MWNVFLLQTEILTDLHHSDRRPSLTFITSTGDVLSHQCNGPAPTTDCLLLSLISINIHKVFYFCLESINKPHPINYKYYSSFSFFPFFL